MHIPIDLSLATESRASIDELILNKIAAVICCICD